MNIADEKRYIYEMMMEITKERKQLTEIYADLKERLDNLSRLEEKGLGETSTQGYIDLVNQRNMQQEMVNFVREATRQLDTIRKEIPAPRFDVEESHKQAAARDREQKMKEKMETMAQSIDVVVTDKETVNGLASNVLEELKKRNMALKPEQLALEEVAVSTEEPEAKPKRTKKQDGIDGRVNNNKKLKPGNLSTHDSAKYIIAILKEAKGEEVGRNDIYDEFIKRTGATTTRNNFTNNTLMRVVKRNTVIKSDRPGYFYYAEDDNE